MIYSNLLKSIVKIFPVLDGKNVKGDCGRICVIGGSYQYSGAPYYSAISALKVGGDLGHIFTNKASSLAIKSYSPEIIVHPYFVSKEEKQLNKKDQENVPQLWMRGIISWSRAINCWVIGPGLGRDAYIAQFFPKLIKNLPSGQTVVFNADAIFHLNTHPYLYQQLPRFKKSILLSNRRQWQSIRQHTSLTHSLEQLDNLFSSSQQITQITPSITFPNFTIILKGKKDIIIGNRSFIVDIQGGRKRCAGIGDIMSGITAVCTFWNNQLGPVLASKITKQATKRAFQKQGRSLVAKDIIKELPKVVIDLQREITK